MLVLNAELRERIVSEAILVPEGNGAALMSRVYRMEAESATHMVSTGYLPYEDVHGTDNEVRLTVAVRQLAAATATTASGVLELLLCVAGGRAKPAPVRVDTLCCSNHVSHSREACATKRARPCITFERVGVC